MGINLDPVKIQAIVDTYGYKIGSWPNSYLGLPLNGKPKTLSFWAPFAEKIEWRIKS